MDDEGLTPEERMAFQKLPREAEPSRILEERIVASLRREGILGGRARAVEAPRFTGGRGWYRPWMAAASVAASLLLFTSGILLGQWMGARSTTQAFIQVREQDAAQVALRIQEAGSAYVAALAALGQIEAAGEGSGDSEVGPPGVRSGVDQGREVAMGALYAAANELARMSPGDADVLRVLQILEDRRAREEGRADEARNVVWF
jgi:hypothetical protein